MANDAAPAATRFRAWRSIRFWIRHWTSIVALAALLAVLVLQTVRWPGGLRISGQLVAGAVTLRLDGELDAQPDLSLVPPEASLRGIGWVSPPTELARGERCAGWVHLLAKELSFSQLQLGRGSLVTLEHAPSGQFLMQAGGAGGTLTFAVDGPVALTLPDTVLKGGDEASGLELSVGTEGSTPEPMVLRARTGSALVLDDLPVSLIRFGHARASGGGFISSVVSGSVKLVDIGDTETLEPGSALQIEEFRGEVVRLEEAEGGYRISFTGRAKRVQLGSPGFAEDLTPSALEFLYHQEWISVMWMSALACIAAVVKVRSWLSGKIED